MIILALFFAALLAWWLALVLRALPGWWRELNRRGEAAGFAVAWFCSGGPGITIGREALAAKHARGKCPRCCRTRSLNADGRLRRHPVPNTNGTELCPGSGGYPL